MTAIFDKSLLLRFAAAAGGITMAAIGNSREKLPPLPHNGRDVVKIRSPDGARHSHRAGISAPPPRCETGK
jgi:hypothetical protein